MPNLEVHYDLQKLQEPTEFARNPKEAFAILGKACQEAVATAYNRVNKPIRAIAPGNVLVRFIKVGEYDVGTPDICFVIKCGRDVISIKEQLHFCELLEDAIRSYYDFEGLTAVFNLESFTADYEMFCKASHGFRRQDGQVIDSW